MRKQTLNRSPHSGIFMQEATCPAKAKIPNEGFKQTLKSRVFFMVDLTLTS